MIAHAVRRHLVSEDMSDKFRMFDILDVDMGGGSHQLELELVCRSAGKCGCIPRLHEHAKHVEAQESYRLTSL